MNILLISSYLPYPLFSGGHIRLYNLIKLLSKKHIITLVCERRDYQTESDIKEVEKFCKKVITVPRRKQWSLGNILTTGFSFSSFLIRGHTSSQMKKILKKIINESQLDLIHVETSYVMQNLPDINIGVPIVLVEHNVEYLVYRRFVDRVPFLLKPFLYLDILKLKYWEEKMWQKVAKLVAVSDEEKKIMQKIRKDVAIVSNGVDINKFKVLKSLNPNPTDEVRVLFIGDFRWIQNRDALKQIINEIWPRLKAELIPSLTEGIKLWVVGQNIPYSIKKMDKDTSIIFDENAPKETQLIYKNASILLAPVWVGGGTSYKILEAMASGVPVVTTVLGNAIGAKENSEILIADKPKDFVEKIIEVLQNRELYKKIAQNARKLVEEKFNWQRISEDLNRVYESLASYD